MEGISGEKEIETMLTEKQKKVIHFCQNNGGKITKKDAMKLINTHYCNGSKHVGDSLSRMVNAGLLARTKPGHFELGKGTKNRPATIIVNQIELL